MPKYPTTDTHTRGAGNVAIAKYASEEWQKCEDSLTPVGLEQAKTAHDAWKKYSPPTPDAFLCSPHRRALRTCAITFLGQRVKVLEGVTDALRTPQDIREKLSGHICDVRSPIDSTLTSEFTSFDFSFTSPVDPEPCADCADLRREADEDVAARVGRALDYIIDIDLPLKGIGITPLLVRAEKVHSAD
ncbi:hypothetical protein EXIGLDRAFT_750481 [Exidia glandulosa HHB12029]|uniref:Uncharacterized protein n=1 Tax=Exidia glandulosa HHB12029 TaxID=1314781 RepID=A0A165GN20_EXIGL|nr:hypothetical protein EXIGLDRAFT_750481 [Exidia glandulosa HHB12029]